MLDEIYKIDSDFSEDKFKTFVDNVFIQIHFSIMTKEIYKIEHFVSEKVYQQLERKVETLQIKKQIQMYDEMNVKETHLVDVSLKDNAMYIKVYIISRYMDYLLDEDGNFISGNNKMRIEKENYLTFMKKIDAKGLEENRKCPNCGASMDINRNGRCQYCNTTFNLDERSWILVDFEVR